MSGTVREQVTTAFNKFVGAAKGAIGSYTQTHVSHVTRAQHVPNITAQGLQPRHGGTGGAGAAVGHAVFQAHSRGFIHFSETSKHDPSNFVDYAAIYRGRGIQPTTLSGFVGRSTMSAAQKDPDDHSPDAMRSTVGTQPGALQPSAISAPLKPWVQGPLGAREHAFANSLNITDTNQARWASYFTPNR